MILQSHFWAYVQKKWNLHIKETPVFPCSLPFYSQEPRERITQTARGQMKGWGKGSVRTGSGILLSHKEWKQVTYLPHSGQDGDIGLSEISQRQSNKQHLLSLLQQDLKMKGGLLEIGQGEAGCVHAWTSLISWLIQVDNPILKGRWYSFLCVFFTYIKYYWK